MNTIFGTKELVFANFSNTIQFCTMCERMSHRTKVLSKYNGNVSSKVLFIAEAPGRLGADKTGIPLFGDKTGDNFNKFLLETGISRNDIFITNAILCNPRKEQGTNDTPNQKEIKNCSAFLEMTINLIQPKIIVPLGKAALDALNNISPHTYTLKENAGNVQYWGKYLLFPMYHPGPRAMVHRTYQEQLIDYHKLSELIEVNSIPLGTNVTTDSRLNEEYYLPSSEYLKRLISTIVSELKEVTLFKLTKLLYLMDIQALRVSGSTITGEIYLRQKDGPWIPQLAKIINEMDKSEITLSFRNRVPFLSSHSQTHFELALPEKKRNVFDDTLRKYKHMDNKAMKIAAYRTDIMQYVLNQEKKGKSMINKVLIYKDKTILDEFAVSRSLNDLN